MNDQTGFRYEISQEEEIPILSQWLMDPSVLCWFPMVNELEVEDAAKVWIGYYGKQFGSAFTVFQGDEVIGFFNLYISPVKKLEHQALFSIIVHPDKRGQGIGHKMIEEMKVRAKRDFHLENLHLEVYRENPAVRLYLATGFVEYGVHTGFLKEVDGSYRDKILMEQWL